MRILHNQSAVSGEHEGASKFLKLRDQTRRNALIYSETLLPKSDDVVRKIKDYAYDIKACDFEDWQESLEEITEEVIEAEKACNLLMQMHDKLVVELKKNEDDAKVGITELSKLKEMYKDEKEKLTSAASEHSKNKEWWDGQWWWTLGFNFLVAKSEEQRMQESLLKATASQRNGEINQEAVNLTEDCLIPAIGEFLKGLRACGAFLTSTREQLEQLGQKGKQGQESAKMRYFKVMKKQAEELDSNCLTFITSSSEIRTNLKAIPSEPCDRNYVDKWLADQLAELKKENHWLTDQVVDKFRSLRDAVRRSNTPNSIEATEEAIEEPRQFAALE